MTRRCLNAFVRGAMFAAAVVVVFSLTSEVYGQTLSISTSALPDGVQGRSYSAPLAANGGMPPYVWTASDLPAGLAISPPVIGNSIGGTPTAVGTSSVTVTVTDAFLMRVSKTLPLRIFAALSINTTALPNGTIGNVYPSTTLTVTGGLAPYTWGLATGSGPLPAGLSLSAGGVISGTPTTSGAFNFTVQASDSSGPPVQSATLARTITIGLGISPGSLPAGTVGTAYSQTLSATGGTAPYSWSLASGSGPLPGGLNLSSGGVISGTPTAGGTFNFTVQASDAGSPARTGSNGYSITIATPLTIAPASLPAGIVGAAYSQTLTATGGSAPYTWSLTSGSALPGGLSLSAGGVISGTPTTGGTFNFTVQVSDGSTPARTGSRAFSLAITLGISPASLPDGSVGTGYSQTLSASGGTAPYTWSAASGSGPLPGGLALSSAGVISGTPTAAGTFNFTVQATDSSNPVRSGTRAFSITVAGLISISPPTLPSGNIGTAYSQTLSASGGATPYTWSIAPGSGPLPGGLTLSSAGVISGTPTATGAFSFTVRVTDSSNPARSGTRDFSITINPAPLTVTSTTLPAGTIGTVYSQNLTATGGTAPYTWSIAGSSLPAGLTLSAAGTISGEPTAVGTSNFTVQVRDSSSTPATATRPLSIVINPSPLTIVTTTLPNGTVSLPYSQTLATTGGTQPFTWSTVGGSLPPGVTLSSGGIISGTPTTAGTFTFVVRVIDNTQAATQSLTIVVGPAPVTVTITTAPSLPGGLTGTAYSQSLEASGGTAPYTWRVSAGQLPAGLTLATNGTLSGTPTAPDSFVFTVIATDAAARTASREFTLVIRPALTIVTVSPLPAAQLAVEYSQRFETSIPGTFAWSVVAGSLPPGLTLSADGVLSGTPTTVATFQFTVQSSGGQPPQTTTKAFQLVVNPAGLLITTTAVPNGLQDMTYSQQFLATGGALPYAWDIAAGTLPPGLNLSASGLLAGVPTLRGAYGFTVRVRDSATVTRTQVINMTVDPPLGALTIIGLPGSTPPTQQLLFSMSLSTPSPTALAGQLRIAFTSTAVIPADDAAVQFSTGSRTVNFTIPANSVTAVFPTQTMRLLTGTVSGTVRLTATLQNGPSEIVVGTISVAQAPPQLTNVVAVRTATGLDVQITGYSPERRVSSVTFGFDVRTASGIQRVNLTRDVESDFAGWYRNPTSAAFGSTFLFRQSFTVQGDATVIETVTVTLTNSQGNTSSTAVRIN